MLNYYTCCIFSLFLTGFSSFSQDNYEYQINGIINADSGVVKLGLLFDEDYYQHGIQAQTATVVNNRFTFSGSIPYPQGYRITYGNRYYSNPFVVEPGAQNVTCNILDARETPKSDNQSMFEYENEYLKAYETVRKKRESYQTRKDSLLAQFDNDLPYSMKLGLELELKGYYLEGDKVLLDYVSEHPTSYIALWKFVHLFSSFGYESIFDSIFDAFSDSIKTSHTGQVLARKLDAAGSLGIEKLFPPFKATSSDKKALPENFFSENNYTLVDFWYSNCGPCIAQFSHLKKTYTKYENRGFGIIGISTDRTKNEENWLRAIEKHELIWPQFWDENGIESAKRSINKFPTNFLIDRNGKILAKDLRPVEIEEFLLKNLQKK